MSEDPDRDDPDTEAPKVPDEEPIPKLPRASLLGKISVPGLVRIGMFATLLYAVIVLRRPCSEGVGRFVGGFDPHPDAAPPTLDQRYPGYELLTAEEALKRWPDAPQDGGLAGDAAPCDDAAPCADAGQERSADSPRADSHGADSTNESSAASSSKSP